MIRPVCKERRRRMMVRRRVNYKLLHGMGLLLCSFLLCACSVPAPADAIEFPPTALTPAQAEQKQEKPAETLSKTAAADLEQIPMATPAPSPAASASPAQTENVPEETVAPTIAPEEPEPTLQPTVAVTPLPTPPEDTPAEETTDDLLTLQSVVEIGSVMRVQIPRALVKEGISPTAEYVVNITYNSEDLLSCVVEVVGADGGTANALVPVTLDLKTGESCKLSDFFSKEDTGWRGLIPDLVTDMAKQKKLTLLCEVPPVGDDQPFYIEDGSIVLLYRPYEITTYEAGAPTFTLSEEELAPYLSGAYGIGE